MSIPTDAVHDPSLAADPVRLRVNKLDLLERLADDLAHEIKNPLHSMVINLEVLKRRAARAGDDSADLQRYAGVLSTELERVNRRIDLLLRLSRPARGADLASLRDLVDELLELIQLEGRHHEVTVHYDPGEQFQGVRVGLETGRQILLNLVLDGLERCGAGGELTISLAGQPGEAWLRVACSGGSAVAGHEPAGERIAIARALAAASGGEVREEESGARLLVLPVLSR